MSLNPLSNKSLIDWAGQQDPTESYDYFNGCKCFLGQYVKAIGLGDAVSGTHILNTGEVDHVLGIPIYSLGRALPGGWDLVSRLAPHTFGGALERAKAILVDE